MGVDWGDLPRELIVRIWFLYERARAASKIQAVWRGRDMRHFLEHPATAVFNSRHPFREANAHLRNCHGCLTQELFLYNLRHKIVHSRNEAFAWTVRCLYIVAYDPERVRYVAESSKRALPPGNSPS